MRSGEDRDENFTKISRLLGEAAAGGAELAVLPEVATWRGPQADEPRQALPIPGNDSERLGQLAAQHGLWLLAGSILEMAGEGDRCFNTSLLFSPNGDIHARYRKIHLFDIDLPGKVSIRESDTRQAGNSVTCVETPFGKIGMAVCYDLRFPELFRALVDQGAEIIVMPSAFNDVTGEAHWEVLLRARAIESQCFLLAPNQVGAGGSGFSVYGHSLAIDPWGRILAEGNGDDEACLLVELNAEVLAQTRRDLPSLQHRRSFS
jgi:predicted amidohydrolase